MKNDKPQGPSRKMQARTKNVEDGRKAIEEAAEEMQEDIDDLRTHAPSLALHIQGFKNMLVDQAFAIKDTVECAEWNALRAMVKQRLPVMQRWLRMEDLYDLDKSLLRYKLTLEEYKSMYMDNPDKAMADIAAMMRNREKYNLAKLLNAEAPTALALKYKDKNFENANAEFYSDMIEAFDAVIALRGLDENGESIPEWDHLLSYRDRLIPRRDWENNLIFDVKAGSTLMLGPYVGFHDEIAKLRKEKDKLDEQLAEKKQEIIAEEGRLQAKKDETRLEENERLDKVREKESLVSEITNLRATRNIEAQRLGEMERRVTARTEQAARQPMVVQVVQPRDGPEPNNDIRGKVTGANTAPKTGPETAPATAKGTAKPRQKDGTADCSEKPSSNAVKTPAGYVWVASDPDGKHPDGTNVRVAAGKDGRHRCIKADGHTLDGSIDSAAAIAAGVTK